MEDASQNELLDTQDGSHTLISKRFGVSYHSKYGAIKESEHVFIDAGLKARMQRDKDALSILEYGFGTGLNAYLALLCAQQYHRDISYTGIEAFPISKELAASLNYPQVLQRPVDDYLQLHDLDWDVPHQINEHFTFTKVLGQIEDQTFNAQFDVLFFDAFAPTAQPELWEEQLLQKAFQALKPGGIFVTYCAKGVVKRTLKSIGFKVEALPGPPGKREMTRGIK
ncbi:MAG: tRNA (5-methylaminomethyl-2-thiouridine)(34)-methyltransferase MnmD [Saprospiraceae bacterium]